MAPLPLTDLLRELAAAIQNEIDAAADLARRSPSFSPDSAPDAVGIRIALELRAGAGDAVQELGQAVERLEAERNRALDILEATLRDKRTLLDRVAANEHSKKAADASARKLRARVRELERREPARGDARAAAEAELEALRQALEDTQSRLEQEKIARAAAEASMAYVEAEKQRLQIALDDALSNHNGEESELSDARKLIDDLQAELGELWRVMREMLPGEAVSINLGVTEGDRRQGVERVQAKIVDARELFKRRHRPLAI